MLEHKFATDMKTKANVFNDIFCRTMHTFEKQQCTSRESKTFNSVKAGFFRVQWKWKLEIIRRLNIHKAHILDDISIRMIKSCGKSLLKPLILLFQNSIKLSCYPDIWKRSNIRDGLRVGSGWRAPSPFFCNHLFFFGHFEELPIVFIEVKLIISNARLT